MERDVMQVHKDNPGSAGSANPLLHPNTSLWEHSGVSILFGLLGFDKKPSPVKGPHSGACCSGTIFNSYPVGTLPEEACQRKQDLLRPMVGYQAGGRTGFLGRFHGAKPALITWAKPKLPRLGQE